MKSMNDIYLSTGIDHLDDLLSPDRQIEYSGGVKIGQGEKRTELETPIVVIEGTTGTGKTGLALQIAHSAARNKNWVVVYYSLEQTYKSLYTVASNFGLIEREGELKVDFYDVLASNTGVTFDERESRIHFCYLSPRPFIKKEETDIFEQRFSELTYVFNKLTASVVENAFILVVIDSITAFAGGRSLDRNEIYRLFTLLRNYHIPGVITLERHSAFIAESEEIFFECTRFLSDIVISLTKDVRVGYLLYYLEIIKSRIGRQALGQHLYKIRTKSPERELMPNEQLGLVIYPSIHYVLSKVRGRTETENKENLNFIIDKENPSQDKKDLCLIFDNHFIVPNSCSAIIGPNGTHKLALGLNIAMGSYNGRKPNLLIISFADITDFNFKGIAWTKFNSEWRNLAINGRKFEGVLTKFWHTYYTIGGKDTEPVVTVTTFKIGQLAPEECFDVIEKIISDEKTSFSSVLLMNTAEICTGFPLLKREPLFLPTLLDLFVVHELVSVCIGVEDGIEAGIKEANFTLLAKADYRIVMSHYPLIHDLSKEIVTAAEGKRDPVLKEQLVSLVLDNVTGRHYLRQPKWVRVEEIQENNTIIKTLHCENSPYIPESKNSYNS